MFTIKWIADNGYEHIYRGSDVRYVPPTAKDHAPAEATVEFDMVEPSSNIDGDSCILCSGQVYVMNEAGKTVANYVLSTASFPHGLEPRQAA